MSLGTIRLGGHDFELTGLRLDWGCLCFSAQIPGPLPDEKTWRGLVLYSSDGAEVYRDDTVRMVSPPLDEHSWFDVDYSIRIASPEYRNQGPGKGGIKQRQRRPSAAEAWEG